MSVKSAHAKSIRQWKSFQSVIKLEADSKHHVNSQKNKQKTRLAILVILLIVSIIAIGQTIRFVTSLHSPKNANLNINRTYAWNKDFPLNILVRNGLGDLGLISYDPKEKLVKVLSIPNGVSFGEGLTNSSSPEALKKALSNFFGLPIDSFLETTGEAGKQPISEIVSSIRKGPFEAFDFYFSNRTDLSPYELINLTYAVTNVRFDKIQNFNLAKLELIEESIGEDGSAVLGASTAKLDTFIAQNLMDRDLREEQATIAIFNATSTPGLAAKVSRIISNMGGNVIFASNASSNNLKKSYLSVKDSPQYSHQRLNEIFAPNCLPEAKCDILEDTDITSSRAQINIVLGSDAVGKY